MSVWAILGMYRENPPLRHSLLILVLFLTGPIVFMPIYGLGTVNVDDDDDDDNNDNNNDDDDNQ